MSDCIECPKCPAAAKVRAAELRQKDPNALKEPG